MTKVPRALWCHPFPYLDSSEPESPNSPDCLAHGRRLRIRSCGVASGRSYGSVERCTAIARPMTLGYEGFKSISRVTSAGRAERTLRPRRTRAEPGQAGPVHDRGKPVGIRCEPVAVTGDDLQTLATGREAGKACGVGGSGSQKTGPRVALSLSGAERIGRGFHARHLCVEQRWCDRHAVPQRINDTGFRSSLPRFFILVCGRRRLSHESRAKRFRRSPPPAPGAGAERMKS